LSHFEFDKLAAITLVSVAMSNPSETSRPVAIQAAFERLAPSLALVEDAMREQLGSDAEIVAGLGEHVLSSGGKRMRPALLIMAAELCGYTGPRAVQTGAAIELLHTATLLHDDVVDLSSLRRGRPSANAIWGNRRAVLGGDFLYARASTMIVDDGNLDILYVFSNTIRLMAEGELLQLQRSFDPSVTEAHYYQVIDRKSATLLSAATETGSIIGGVTRAERRRLTEFGRQVGLAFQLRDDALDYEAGEEVLGKKHLADLREGKVTMPLLLTLKRCTTGERERIGSLLKDAARMADISSEERPDAEFAAESEAVAALVARYRGVEDTVRRAEEHVRRASDSIAAFPDSEVKRSLLSAASYAAARDR
jgi:octaprenyl-diphosphate synthase